MRLSTFSALRRDLEQKVLSDENQDGSKLVSIDGTFFTV